MGRRADYTLLVTDKAGGSQLCQPIGTADALTQDPGWSKIELRPRYQAVGSATVTLAALPEVMDALYTPDARIVARRSLEDGSGLTDVPMAGSIEIPETGFVIERDGTDGFGTVTVNFAEDQVLLTRRQVYPDPAHESNAQTAVKYAPTGTPETLVWDLVNLNLGPGAIVSRRKAGLSMRAKLGLNPGVSVSPTFTRDWILMDALREVDRLAKAAGIALGIGWRIADTGTGLQFQTFAPQDLADKVLFSRLLGNVTAGTYSVSAPTVTHAITGDAGGGTARVISERVNAAAIASGWDRREAFIDASSAVNLTEQNKIGDQALLDGDVKIRAEVTARDVEDLQYGYEFDDGDQVSYQPYPGGPYITARCLGADITVTPEAGELTVPIIGTDDQDSGLDAKAAEIRRLWTAVGRLQGAR